MLAMLAAAAALSWTMPDGRVAEERVELARIDDGVRLEVSREKILAMKARRLDIVPDFARAKKGEAGYWFSPYGVYGEYDRDDGRFFTKPERTPMAAFGFRGVGYFDVVTICEPRRCVDRRHPCSPARIKEGYDIYQGLKHLQLEFIESHEEIAPGVFRTGYSNGESVVVNYTDKAFAYKGESVPAESWKLVR